MKTKVIISILFLLLLTSLACTSADYAATFHLDYEPTMPIPSAEAQPSATMPSGAATVPPTPSVTIRVCTGVENGTLRVRNTPGVNHAMVFTLHEGQRVSTTAETQETNDGATWVKITDPEGWVNQRFLCEKE